MPSANNRAGAINNKTQESLALTGKGFALVADKIRVTVPKGQMLNEATRLAQHSANAINAFCEH